MMIPFSFHTGHNYSRAHGFYIFWMLLWYSYTRPNNVDDVKWPTRRIRQNENLTNSNFQHQYPDGSYHFIPAKLAAVFRRLIQIIASSTSSLTPFSPCSFGRDSSTNLHIRRVKQIIRLLDGFISKRDHDYHFSRFNWAWTVILNLKNVKDSN